MTYEIPMNLRDKIECVLDNQLYFWPLPRWKTKVPQSFHPYPRQHLKGFFLSFLSTLSSTQAMSNPRLFLQLYTAWEVNPALIERFGGVDWKVTHFLNYLCDRVILSLTLYLEMLLARTIFFWKSSKGSESGEKARVPPLMAPLENIPLKLLGSWRRRRVFEVSKVPYVL